MNLSGYDWSVIALFVLALAGFAFYVKRYNRGVTDFLAASRCADRYLLSITQGLTSVGAITFIAWFEMYYRSGFCAIWWGLLSAPLGLIFSISGWITYRYRETRVLTMAQFFETRYTKNFRIFCGILAWIAGVLNMAIFPAISARFFIHICGLPQHFELFGFQLSTFVTFMIVELSIALVITLLGGMIIIMITDFFQGIFCNIAFVVILIALAATFDWSQITTALKAAPENASMLNPYKTSTAEGFNVFYFLMSMFIYFYGSKAWQGTQGFNAAARTPHEAKMAGIISVWREQMQVLLFILIPICAFTLMHHSDFTSQAELVKTEISKLGSETLQKQLLVPTAILHMLPKGILGLFVTVMLAAVLSIDDIYLHSWGSIFVQDVVLPFRKKSFTPKQHMHLLRISIILVAITIFTFSLFFKQNDFIFMYLQMTCAIYVGGAGAVIIGGLYWKRGSVKAAWAAMIISSTLTIGGGICQYFWPQIRPALAGIFPSVEFFSEIHQKFPLDGMRISFVSTLLAISSYVLISLFDWLIRKKPAVDMNQILHRGKYTIQGEHKLELPPTGWKALLPTSEFTKFDKFLYFALITWCFGWFFAFIGITCYYILTGASLQFWINFWAVKLSISIVLGTIGTIWFLCGGLRDLKTMIKTLKNSKVNTADDGRAIHLTADENTTDKKE
jgi:SSS family solute:Na+ symporter